LIPRRYRRWDVVTIRPYKRGGWEYDLRIKLPDGVPYQERRKAPGKTKADAVEYARQREAHLIRHGLSEKAARDAPKVPTLREFAPQWLGRYAGERRLKQSTRERYASLLDSHILPLLGHLPLDEITSARAAELAARMSEYSTHHAKGALMVLSRLLRVAERWEVLEAYPIRHAPSVPRTVPIECWYSGRDCERLVEAAKRRGVNTYIVVLLGVDAGLRAGEILGLEWTDLDLEVGRLVVKRTVYHGHVSTPKGGKERSLPLTRRLLEALRAARHLRGARVILDKLGRTPSHGALQTCLRKAQRLAGLELTGKLHTLRHTFCSRLAAKGAPARSIQALAGHSSLRTTQIYMHLSPLEIDRSIHLLEEGDEQETVKARSK
jgi:integrase